MKLNLKFVNKIPKSDDDNEIILLKDKKIKNKALKPLSKYIFSSKLYFEKKFIIRNLNNKNYIFVNCSKSNTGLDYEKLGSELYIFLKYNKIENSFINTIGSSINHVQLEKFLHGAQLKSYNFEVYKSDKSQNKNIVISVITKNFNKSNLLRNKLKALLEGVFLTRDLVSEPGNILHPDEYAKRILKLKKFGLKVTVYDQKNLKN